MITAEEKQKRRIEREKNKRIKERERVFELRKIEEEKLKEKVIKTQEKEMRRREREQFRKSQLNSSKCSKQQIERELSQTKTIKELVNTSFFKVAQNNYMERNDKGRNSRKNSQVLDNFARSELKKKGSFYSTKGDNCSVDKDCSFNNEKQAYVSRGSCNNLGNNQITPTKAFGANKTNENYSFPPKPNYNKNSVGNNRNSFDNDRFDIAMKYTNQSCPKINKYHLASNSQDSSNRKLLSNAFGVSQAKEKSGNGDLDMNYTADEIAYNNQIEKLTNSDNLLEKRSVNVNPLVTDKTQLKKSEDFNTPTLEGKNSKYDCSSQYQIVSIKDDKNYPIVSKYDERNTNNAENNKLTLSTPIFEISEKEADNNNTKNLDIIDTPLNNNENPRANYPKNHTDFSENSTCVPRLKKGSGNCVSGNLNPANKTYTPSKNDQYSSDKQLLPQKNNIEGIINKLTSNNDTNHNKRPQPDKGSSTNQSSANIPDKKEAQYEKNITKTPKDPISKKMDTLKKERHPQTPPNVNSNASNNTIQTINNNETQNSKSIPEFGTTPKQPPNPDEISHSLKTKGDLKPINSLISTSMNNSNKRNSINTN